MPNGRQHANAEVWRRWARGAPGRVLEEFLGDFDAGETELEVTHQTTSPLEGTFIVEVRRKGEDEEDE